MKCPVCLKEIPDGARKCTECDSYLDWRRYLTFSTVVLALLVALVSVIGTTIPVLFRSLETRRPVLSGVVGSTSLERLDSSVGSTEVIAVTLMLQNSGDRDALVASVWWNKENGTKETWQQARHFTDLELPAKLLVPARSPRALVVYLAGRYEQDLYVVVDYYGAGEELFRADLPVYTLSPAPTVRFPPSEFIPPGVSGPDGIGDCHLIAITGAAVRNGEGSPQSIEVKNLTANALQLGGWTLEDDRYGVTALSDEALEPGETVSLSLPPGGARLNAMGGHLSLKSHTGFPVCIVTYGEADFASHQWPFSRRAPTP